MAEIAQVFEQGLDFGAYHGRMRVHADAFEEIYESLGSIREEVAGSAPLGRGQILVLTEDYCIDSVLNLPLARRLAEASPEVELRIASRDSHRELASRFPGRGGVSRLPTVIFLDGSGEALGHWSERSRHDHAWMAEFLARDPMPDFVLEDGIPEPTVAAWMTRRLAAQRPFFEKVSWRYACAELAAIAARAAAG